MKKTTIVIIVIAVIAAVVAAVLISLRFWPVALVGSGNLETKEYAFTDFTEVDIGWTFEFEVRQSSSYTISITADDNVMDYVEVSKKGQALRIRLERASLIGPVTLRASVTMPGLLGLTASGASHGTVSGFASTEDLHMIASGASGVTGNITAGDVEFDMSGASTIELEGSASDIDANVGGGSHLNLEDFVVDNADINFSGGSWGTVNLSGRLDANLSGASTLWYIGEPIMGDINTSGASTISER
jgi:hypothetical protein